MLMWQGVMLCRKMWGMAAPGPTQGCHQQGWAASRQVAGASLRPLLVDSWAAGPAAPALVHSRDGQHASALGRRPGRRLALCIGLIVLAVLVGGEGHVLAHPLGDLAVAAGRAKGPLQGQANVLQQRRQTRGNKG